MSGEFGSYYSGYFDSQIKYALQMQSPSHLFEYRLSQAIALSVQVLEVLHDMEAHR